MSDPRPLASVSLDVDDQWSYMKTHGDAGWESRPSYYDVFWPAALEILAGLDLKITFMIVGVDAARPEHHGILRTAVAAGHEMGNHSEEHEPWLQRYSPEQLRHEIATAEEHITVASGQRPIGFRGPGFSWSPTLLEVLEERGYLYDASTLPTFLGPLARAYYFRTAKLTKAERAERAALFGTWRDGLRPVTPYRWRLATGKSLLEIPVTTIPGIKTPFHLSYLLYLSRYSNTLMMAYLQIAIAACRLTGTEPSFLLHPLDLLGGDQVPSLKFFPGMDISGRRKAEVFRRVMGELARHFQLVTMSTHAKAITASPGLPQRPALPAAA
jgi:peptidoglycan-N-acetylglucosamine deacetylase